MSQYPRAARNPSIKCVSCNAPVITTTDNAYVCIECGSSPVRRRPPRIVTTEPDGAESDKSGDNGDNEPVERANGSSPAIEMGRRFLSSRRHENGNRSIQNWNESPGQDSHPASTFVMAAIPAYNEAKTIPDVIRDTAPYVDTVLVVDDGSDDDTARQARAAGATVIEHDRNRGYGGALQTIFREANERNVDNLVVLDGDGQHDAADISKLVTAQHDVGAQIVIGSRFKGDGKTEIPLYRRIGLTLINQFIGIGLAFLDADFNVRDTQSGYRAYDRQAIQSLATSTGISNGMDASIDVLFHACRHDYTVHEVETVVSYEGPETSTHNPISHGISLVKRVVHTVKFERPLTVLAVPGFFSTSIGVGIGLWTVSRYLQSGQLSLGFVTLFILLTLMGLFASITGSVFYSIRPFLDISD